MKEIPGYPGYHANRDGNIYSTKRKGVALLMKKGLTNCGYEKIGFYVDRKKVYPLVHRLILSTFAGHPGGLHCNHKNGNRTDNRLSNLEWVTRSENERHARRELGKLMHGHHNTLAKLTDKKVTRIRQLRREGWTFQSLADKFGIGVSHACRVAKGEVWRHIP